MSRSPVIGNEVFRVRVKYIWGDRIFGPYSALSSARACETREAYGRRRDVKASSIERLTGVWEEVK